MEGVSLAAIHALSNVVQRKSFMRDQLCLAHPPDPSLGASAFSYDYVYLIFSGEARLLCSGEHASKTAPPVDPSAPAYGPLVEAPPPTASKVERHLGQVIVPVATLGPGECISDNCYSEAARHRIVTVAHPRDGAHSAWQARNAGRALVS